MMRDEYLIILFLVIISLFVPAISYHQRIVQDAEARENMLLSALSGEGRDAILNTEPAKTRGYRYPIARSVITSSCGYRTNPMGGGTERLHKGVDLVGKEGSPIRAALSGVVSEHWPAPDGYYSGHPVYGGLVVIETDGVYLLYGHMSETRVREGQHVAAGEVIGTMGSTGVSTGPHLHFEVVVDPFEYLERMR